MRSDGVETIDATALDPVRIFTADLELRGFVAAAGQRVTDMLLRGQDLAFLPAGAAVSPENWISVSPADILFVEPPPLAQRASWQERRNLHRVAVRLPGHQVMGTAHLPPGYEVGADLAASHSFLPVTSAVVTMPGTAQTEQLDVAIVNLDNSSEARIIG